MSGEEPTTRVSPFAGLTLMGRRLRATADSSARLATIRLPPHDLHAMDQPVLAVLVPAHRARTARRHLRSDVPATWHLSPRSFALSHAASGELTAGRMPEAEVEAALAMTVLGAVTRSEE